MATRSLPLTAGALLVGGVVHSHTAIRGDVPPRLHPLVRLLLDQLPTAYRERFAGWCAEMVLVSDRLWEAEQEPGQLDLAAAREALSGAAITTVFVREGGDPAHGSACEPCRSCQAVLDALGVGVVRPPATGASGDAHMIQSQGTQSQGTQSQAAQSTGAELARRWALTLSAFAAPDGRRHDIVAAALDVYARFGGQLHTASGDGAEVAPSGYLIDPTRAIHTVRTLAEFGSALGTRISPLGIEIGGSGFLAVEETGRLFVIDHTAEWFLGDSAERGLAVLRDGRMPVRVRVDGTWLDGPALDGPGLDGTGQRSV